MTCHRESETLCAEQAECFEDRTGTPWHGGVDAMRVGGVREGRKLNWVEIRRMAPEEWCMQDEIRLASWPWSSLARR